jgi:hypothetical protein
LCRARILFEIQFYVHFCGKKMGKPIMTFPFC